MGFTLISSPLVSHRVLENSSMHLKSAAAKRSVVKTGVLSQSLFFKGRFEPFTFVSGLPKRQFYLLSGKEMLPGGLGIALGNASPWASLLPLARQGCEVWYNPGKAGEGTGTELVFLKPVRQSSCCRVPLEREEYDKVTQRASQPWSWAPNQPQNGVAASGLPGLHPRTPEHPFVTAWNPFREPSAPPSVPKYSRGSVLHIRDMSELVPEAGAASHIPTSTRNPSSPQLPPLFSRLTTQIPSASSQV